MVTIKDFAAQQGCSETIVYRHIRNHKEALGDRVQKVHGKTWLTDEGAEYIRGLMTQAPLVVSDVSEEVERLRKQLDDANAAFQKYAAETVALIAKASEQILLAETSEANQQRADELEAQNGDLRAERDKLKEEASELEKQALEASVRLQEVRDQLAETKRENEQLRNRKWYELLFKKRKE